MLPFVIGALVGTLASKAVEEVVKKSGDKK